MKKLAAVSLGIALAAWGCGGGSSSPTPSVSVTLSPTSANVHLLRTKQFAATVVNAANAGVTWSLSGADCSGAGANCGSVSSTGLYTAPSSLPSPAQVTITATSVADTSKSAAATVTLLPSIVMTVGPADKDIKVGETQQFTVTVQNAIDASVNWKASGAGCTGAACGTISATGLYTAPSVVPNPPAITVTATSVEDPLASASVPATVVSAVALSLWPPRVLVALGTSYQFGAFVSGTANTAVRWSLSGAACSGDGCGVIGPTGRYTGPPTLPSFDEVTVTATSEVDPARTATATVRLVASNAGKLNGPYAFLYQGFAGGAPGATEGMFMADGQGNLTYGISDRAWPDAVGGNLVGARFTGTYVVGNDNRGLLYLHGAAFGDVTLAFALNAAGNEAFIEPFFDASTRLLGKLVKLDLPVSDNSAIKGDYVFQWLGADDAGNRRGALGRLHADGYGAITTGKLDISNGTSVLEDLALTGSYSVSLDGRTTMTLVIPAVGTVHLVAYALTNDRFFMMSIDPVSASAPMWSGPALAQDGQPFSNASLQGTGVFNLLGRPGPTQARTGLGLLTSDAGCGVTGVVDANVNGTVTTGSPYAATCSIRPDGRGTLASATLTPMIFYVVSPGTALLMGAPGGAVDLGFLEPRLAASYGPTALVGQFVEGASVPPPYDGSLVLSGTAFYDPAGGFSWTLDAVSSVGGLSQATGAAVVTSVDASGHGVLTDLNGNHSYVYMISPMKLIVLEGYVAQQTMADQNLLYTNIR